MRVTTHQSVLDAAGYAGHLYEWSCAAGSGYATGPSVAAVRAHLAYGAHESGYYKSVGAALVALKVHRVKGATP